MERRTSILLLLLLLLLLLHLCSSVAHADSLLLNGMEFEGQIDFHNTREAAHDFGHFSHSLPLAILHPSSVKDISKLIKTVYNSASNLTIAAKGHAHSIHGQAQTDKGVVIEMSSLRGIQIYKGGFRGSPYVEVYGGELWIDVLHKTLTEGLAPRSWTDYLYLSVGGTLSNAGISGQAFRYGPQISNVYQLEVVTGKGDRVICSKKQNSELFYATLGGLGQFGIITKARIALEPAPQRVKWIRVLYSDFNLFTRDQEYLISKPGNETFDYIEGFVVMNSEGILTNWRSSLFKQQNPDEDDTILNLPSNGQMMYYLEVAKNYYLEEADVIDQIVASLLAPLRCIPSSVFSTDISYVDFLDRVHAGELQLRSKGLWDIPHPWLNLFVPKSLIADFHSAIFKQLLAGGGGGPLLLYPMNKNKWDPRMSAIIPDEDVFYLVALLRSSSNDTMVEELIQQNNKVLEFCKSTEASANGVKQYLPRFTKQDDWMKHYGRKWKTFVERKIKYDPLGMLTPGQNIFTKRTPPQMRELL